jgi:hypothetical protein
MSTPANLISSTAPIDEDLAEQAHRGHGVPSQDPDPAAHFRLQPEEAKREANSVLVGGSLVAGAATGAAIGVVAAGPVGVVVGATLGAVAGALGGAAAGVSASPKVEGRAGTEHGTSIEPRPSLSKGLNLKRFVLLPEMVNIWGIFYPTGYVFVMFPTEQQAEQAGRELVSGGYDREAIMILSPETILREIAPVDGGDAKVGLPSAGTESAKADNYISLAHQGQSGLMVHAESDEDTEVVMSAVRSQAFSYALKYHMLAIEDLK